ncbi:MAG: hypothetical protein NVSMB38_34970 [Ktedonobacteraceae bacterium]
MMNSSELVCKEVVELVTDYVEQALLPEMRAKVDEHLTNCPGCALYSIQVRQTIAALRTLTSEVMFPETREELLQQFRQLRGE